MTEATNRCELVRVGAAAAVVPATWIELEGRITGGCAVGLGAPVVCFAADSVFSWPRIDGHASAAAIHGASFTDALAKCGASREPVVSVEAWTRVGPALAPRAPSRLADVPASPAVVGIGHSVRARSTTATAYTTAAGDSRSGAGRAASAIGTARTSLLSPACGATAGAATRTAGSRSSRAGAATTRRPCGARRACVSRAAAGASSGAAPRFALVIVLQRRVPSHVPLP